MFLGMKVIEKKVSPESFGTDKDLPVDLRLADFDLEAGDQIRYREHSPQTGQYTGKEYTKTVKRVTKCRNPNKYWKAEDLEKFGLYLIEFD